MIGAIHATLPYAAPEVVREHFTTVESDIWSLGATLYHAVEGRLPYGVHDTVTRPTPEPVAPQRKRGRVVALGALVLVVLAGLGVGIGAAVAAWPRTVVPPPTTAPAAPPTNAAIPGLPAQVGYVALANPSPDVDPCRLADLPALKALGEITVDRSTAAWSRGSRRRRPPATTGGAACSGRPRRPPSAWRSTGRRPGRRSTA